MATRPVLALIDGYSLAYRAFYALPEDLTTSTGQVTNAAYGFTSMLIKLLGDHDLDGIAAVFDKGRPAHRLDVMPEYKANRKESPDEFRSQLPLIDEVLVSLAIPRVDLEGNEADDLIASYAEVAKTEGWDVLVVTGDRDLFQLADDNVKILYTRKGISDTVIMDPSAVEEKYGVPPKMYPMLAALRGDPSDNIPGVPGVGDKTAAKLLQRFGDIDGIYAHIDEIGGKKVPTMLQEHEEDVRASVTVTTIIRDLPLPKPVEELAMGSVDVDAAQQLFTTLEFRTLWERLNDTVLGRRERRPIKGFDASPRIAGAGDVARWLDRVPSGHPVAIVPDMATGLPAPVATGVAFAAPGADPISVMNADMADEDRVSVRELLNGTRGCPLWVHDGKQLHHYARVSEIGEVAAFDVDAELWAYVLEPASRDYSLERLALTYLHKKIVCADELLDSDAVDDGQMTLVFDEEANDERGRAHALEAAALLEIAEVLADEVRQRGQEELVQRIEVPLIPILAQLETVGVAVDGTVLAELQQDMADRVESARQEALVAIGTVDDEVIADHRALKFLDSPKQLQHLLFEVLELPKTKKIKTGWSTDAKELKKLSDRHPVVAAVLDYREYTKLKSTYIDPLFELVGGRKLGRVHAELNQTVAVTGRLSSQNPNLQNIPIRTALGRRIREAFVPGEGFDKIVVADYSQIELRVMAHLSKDEGLLEAFASGDDIHAQTAAMVFDTPIEQIDNGQRSKIKGMTYGLAYGLSAYGLAQQLAIPQDEAAELMNAYFDRFPAVGAYLQNGVEEARRSGYTETLTGRRRYLPDLTSDNRQRRQMAERMALNAPIQGTAADIMKLAMIDADRALKETSVNARMVLQVHDELVCECAENDVEATQRVLIEAMSTVIELAVPLEVDTAVGTSWATAEKH